MTGRTARGPVRALSALVVGYRRWISPLLGPTCRFHPTCSAYALDALREHGVLRGLGLTGWRLLRCGPWHPGGIDYVPRRSHPASVPVTEERATC